MKSMILLFLSIATIHVSSAEAASTSSRRNTYSSGFHESISRIMQSSSSLQIQSSTSSASSLSSSSSSSSSFSSQQSRHLTALDEKTQPIRIKFFTAPIEEAIAQTNNVDQKQGGQLLLNTILPAIDADFANTISVEPINSGFQVPNTICDGIYSNYLPSNYNVDNADLLILVSSFTTIRDSSGNVFEWCSTDAGSSTLAAATSCGQDPTSKRPIVGLMNVCLSATANQDKASMEEILSHELLHVLAVSEYLFPFYRNALTGRPLTSNPNIAQRIKCVNGNKPMNFYSFSSNVLRYRTETVKYNYKREKRGYYEITLPTVRQVVRNQFDCQGMTGARLENQPTNPNSCIGSHFDERFFQYNIMSALYDSTSVHFTPLTLALLEDSGWYKVDFSKAENSPFGIHSGCDFTTKDCIVQNQVATYAEGNFCADYASSEIWRCDPGHNYRGVCDMYDYRLYDTALTKPGREYFSNPFNGPLAFVHADWCPTIFKYGDNSAECQDLSATKIDNFEEFGKNSKCLNVEVNGREKALCISSTCNNDEKQLQFDVNGVSYSCGYGDTGKQIQLVAPNNNVYKFTCPKLAQACPDMFCPSMCSGKGVCNWDAEPHPVCICNGVNDTSTGCYFSPPNDPSIGSRLSISLLVISVTIGTCFLMIM